MKLFIGGTCHAAALAVYCATMNAQLTVERIPWTRESDPPDGLDGIVFWQLIAHRARSGEPAKRIFFYPHLWYGGFHPDLTYLRDGAGRHVDSLLATCHSRIAVEGLRRGLSHAETRRLFRSDVFDRAGYFGNIEEQNAQLLGRAEACGLDFTRALSAITRTGAFMHTNLHPKPVVVIETARALLQAAGVPIVIEQPEHYVADPLLDGPVWPVYPEIAQHAGFAGDYHFKGPRTPDSPTAPIYDLDAIIADTYARLDGIDVSSLAIANRRGIDWSFLDEAAPLKQTTRSPYVGLPDDRFWRRVVGERAEQDIDPAAGLALAIDRKTRIATAGSCFGQHVSAALRRSNYTYLVTEPAPPEMPADVAASKQYGTYSARYGNIYTARALRQLFERAFGHRVPSDSAWQRADGRLIDPFRPTCEPDGFATAADVANARITHYAAVRKMFRTLDVLVFTLGQTEEWYARTDGSVFPLAPGAARALHDPIDYAFRNATTADVAADLDEVLAALHEVNPRARMILTVSPVPLLATREPRNVIISAMATKATLRAAADEIERRHENVAYFPSYEITTSPAFAQSRFAADRRTVTPDGVDAVMQRFFAACERRPEIAVHAPDPAFTAVMPKSETELEIVCDEELNDQAP